MCLKLSRALQGDYSVTESVMANQEFDVDDCKEVFLLYDRVGDSKIQVDDVGEVLRALGSNPTQSELAKMEQQFKLKKDKRITFDQFWPVFQATKARKLTPGIYKSTTTIPKPDIQLIFRRSV